MEQSRLIIAIAVSFAIFFLWSLFFSPNPDELSTETVPQAEENMQAAKQPVPESDRLLVRPSAPAMERDSAKTVTVDTSVYRITISEKGAAVTGMTLKQYKETNEKDSPPKELIPPGLENGSVLLSLANGSDQDLSEAIFTLDRTENHFSALDDKVELLFSYQLPDGMIIEKQFSFSPDSYLIRMQIRLQYHQNNPINGQLILSLRDLFPDGKKAFGFLGPSALVGSKLKQITMKKIDETDPIQGPVKWIALEQAYFMSSLVFQDPIEGRIVPSAAGQLVQNQLVLDLKALEPGPMHTFNFNLFMGPKDWSMLRSFSNDLDRAINFGWVDFLAKPCLWFMNFIHKYVPNYGVAIIILTLVTRLLFWPLTHRSYKGMSDMRKLQPLMKEIREKYKNDKARINQETMALYRTYKINPMSGCLPMIIQLPVFFALYRMLYQAIELRHAPFFGWIQDLSAPDRLFNFDFKIPFMDPPYGIPVMTIIMGATMLLQQKMTPTPGDPAQAKMMMIMPIVFMVIFINFSSGLVLYWMVGNIISITQQYFTQKKLA